jgi:hypothetical protein
MRTGTSRPSLFLIVMPNRTSAAKARLTIVTLFRAHRSAPARLDALDAAIGTGVNAANDGHGLLPPECQPDRWRERRTAGFGPAQPPLREDRSHAQSRADLLHGRAWRAWGGPDRSGRADAAPNAGLNRTEVRRDNEAAVEADCFRRDRPPRSETRPSLADFTWPRMTCRRLAVFCPSQPSRSVVRHGQQANQGRSSR